MGDEIERDYVSLNQSRAVRKAEYVKSNENNDERAELKLNNNNNNNNAQSSSNGNDHDVHITDAAGVQHNDTTPNIKLKIKILIIQNIGMVLGFAFMLFMALYSETITLA
jgi:hypothetical protein